jgi:hypothetical protein
MPQIDVPLSRIAFGKTSRRDLWWVPPLVTFVILSAFVGYATWAGIQNAHYTYGPYLSPLYSPLLFTADPSLLHHAWFGMQPDWFPWFITPAALILPAPAGFRLTCYYYRGAYYKAFWADPVNCAVGEPGFRGQAYRGEHKVPLVVMNLHRYFLYLAIAYLFILSYDAWLGMWWDDGHGGKQFGIGLGTLILVTNVCTLSLYTLGCHSFRHLIGGVIDRLSGRTALRRSCYDCVSALNRRHMMFAWISLFVVGGTDIYIRLCSMGVISDPRII